MTLHRIFVAINLPDGFKTELLECQKKWPGLPARWVSKDNLHLTLAFLGNTSKQELAEVSKLMQELGERHSTFQLSVSRIVYGPDEKRPRMIWAVIEKSPRLLTLQKDVEQTLAQSNQISYQPEKRSFSPHLTLARLKVFELQRVELDELPEVNEDILLAFRVQSIEVMESKLKRSGAEYTIVREIPFTLRSYGEKT